MNDKSQRLIPPQKRYPSREEVLRKLKFEKEISNIIDAIENENMAPTISKIFEKGSVRLSDIPQQDFEKLIKYGIAFREHDESGDYVSLTNNGDHVCMEMELRKMGRKVSIPIEKSHIYF